MPRRDEREDAGVAADRPTPPQHDEQTRREQTTTGAPKQAHGSSDTSADPDLAAYRSRLAAYRCRIEEQLAARRLTLSESAPPDPPAMDDPRSDTFSVKRAMTGLKTFADSLRGVWILLIVVPFAMGLVVGGALWWSLRADSTPAEDLRQALQQERSTSERLSREVAAAWRQLTVQATALADRAALEQETHDLRRAMQQAEESSTELQQTLAQERERSRQLEQQLAIRRDLAAERSGQQREAAAMRQSLQQAQDQAATHERSLVQERTRADRLETELRDTRQALSAAEERGGALSQQLAALRDAPAAERAAQERDAAALRQSLQQAQDQAATHERSLAQERTRGDRLETELRDTRQVLSTAEERGGALAQQLAALRDAPAAERAAQERDAAALRQSLQQAQDQAATHERSLAQERTRADRLETELRDTRQALNAAEQRGGALEQQLGEERSRNQHLEERPSAEPQTASAAVDRPSVNDRPPPAAVAVAPDDADLSRLMQRARLLVGQGDIGAARSVLERAAESGNGPALFALAETFDPVVLVAWGTVGTQGDLARARDLYARALAGGVLEARERLAMPRR